MLADSEALQGVLKTTISIQTLMPKKAKLVEAERDPKWLIDQMIQRAYPHKPGQWSRIKGILYEDLASLVSLEKLGRLLAYQQFVQDFTEALMNLNIIQRR